MLEVLHISLGILTILISVVGGVIAFYHFAFYSKAKDINLSQKLRLVFLSDALIYFITLMFGMWALFHWTFEAALVLHFIRIPLLMLNICASVRLYMHYKLIKR